MWLCVMFYGLSKLNLLKCLMQSWGVRKFVKVEFLFEKFGFEDHLKSWTFMSYHKNSFSNNYAGIFSRIFQNFCLFEIWPIKFVFRPIEMLRRKMAFSFKSLEFPRFLPDSFWSVGHLFMWFSIPAQFLLTDQISDLKT